MCLFITNYNWFHCQESKVGEDYVPYIPRAKPVPSEDDTRQQSSGGGVTTEFDDILEGLDDADLAELASEQ